MQHLRKTYQESLRGIAVTLTVLFGIHFLSIHGFTEALVYCFEENGQVNIESEVGSLFSIPSEDVMHDEHKHSHQKPTYGAATNPHKDVSLSSFCSKEQQVTRFGQERIMKPLSAIFGTVAEKFFPSREFQYTSFIPSLVEDHISASLQTIVLLN